MLLATMKRVLVVQLADIGDLVLSTPALAALREAHPHAHIALLTSVHAAPIVEDTGLVDAIITFDRRQFNNSKSLFRPEYLPQVSGTKQGFGGVVGGGIVAASGENKHCCEPGHGVLYLTPPPKSPSP